MNILMNTIDLFILNFKPNQRIHMTNLPLLYSVYLMFSLDYEKVGYIASELTRYLHPLLKDPPLLVSVKKFVSVQLS